MPDVIAIEVVYPLADKQEILAVKVPANATVGQAIEASGIVSKYPEIDLARNKVGIFAKLTRLDAPLRHRDRIEIYRPLLADPKAVRKQRAAEGKVTKKGAAETDKE